MAKELDKGSKNVAGLKIDSEKYYQEWFSPFLQLDKEPANSINFFKESSEQKPLKLLMEYGPFAAGLPLSFLRVEAFGPIQSQITNSLQTKKGKDNLSIHISCSSAKSYEEILSRLRSMLEHVVQLQLASFYAIKRCKPIDNIVPLFEGEMAVSPGDFEQNISPETSDANAAPHGIGQAESAQAFKALTRQGFSEEFLDQEGAEGFVAASTALVSMGNMLKRFLGSEFVRGEAKSRTGG